MNAIARAPDLQARFGEGGGSSASISILFGPALAVGDSVLDSVSAPALVLQLAPGQIAVIGRAHGREVPYLDPAYRPTSLVPGTGETILRGDGDRRDLTVSRGHFMLSAHPAGLLLTNGVPRRGGGVRPPMNGTLLLGPIQRSMAPGEEQKVPYGSAIVLQLPNGTQVRIEAR
ncbi:MAG TPA: hypothetical protein VFV87_04855 [Pirellulaceae bacterium]|nr:hypothetical protein [Pirellulaceae bacterium]